jgi:hypothetical protein
VSQATQELLIALLLPGCLRAARTAPKLAEPFSVRNGAISLDAPGGVAALVGQPTGAVA